MKKSKSLAFKTANEWKARGFKSSTAQPDDPTSAPVASQPRGRPVRPVEQGETIQKTWAKPAGLFKTPESSEAEAGPPKKKLKIIAKTNNPAKPSGQTGQASKPKAKKKFQKPAGQSATQDSAQGGDGSTSTPKPKKKKAKPKAEQSEAPASEEASDGAAAPSTVKPKRKKQKFKGYSLFVGNLSYETTKEDLLKHFSKAGPIKDVRIPLGKEDNKPKGFAYLEMEDHITYEKVLSLHHSFLNKRRINVECTFGGSSGSKKRKALIKEKTLKLRFLSREGKISSAKQKKWGKFVPAAENPE